MLPLPASAEIVSFPNTRHEAERAAAALFGNAFARLAARSGDDLAQRGVAQGFIGWAARHMAERHANPMASARELCREILAATQQEIDARAANVPSGGFDPSDGDERNGLGGAA